MRPSRSPVTARRGFNEPTSGWASTRARNPQAPVQASEQAVPQVTNKQITSALATDQFSTNATLPIRRESGAGRRIPSFVYAIPARRGDQQRHGFRQRQLRLAGPMAGGKRM